MTCFRASSVSLIARSQRTTDYTDEHGYEPLVIYPCLSARSVVRSLRDRLPARECRVGSHLFLDAEKLVVLRQPFAAGDGADLDLAGAGSHGEIGDGRV